MKQFFILFVCIFLSAWLVAQTETTFKPSGKPIMQVFGYSKFDVTHGAKQPISFGITRAHLGYQYSFSKTLTGTLIADLAGRTTSADIRVTDVNGQPLSVTNSGKEGSEQSCE